MATLELIGITFSCDCVDGFHGKLCSLPPCSPNPCGPGVCLESGISLFVNSRDDHIIKIILDESYAMCERIEISLREHFFFKNFDFYKRSQNETKIKVLNKIKLKQSVMVMNAIALIRTNLVLIAATLIALIYDVGSTGLFRIFSVRYVNVFAKPDFMAQIAKIEIQPSLAILAMIRLDLFATDRVKYVIAARPNAHVMSKMVISWTIFYLL